MKKKILLSIMLLFTICFSVFGFAGCDDSRDGAPTLEVDLSKIESKNGLNELIFEPMSFDVLPDKDDNDLIDSTDMILYKNELLKGIVITYTYKDKDGKQQSKTWNDYQSFINDGGNVTGFNLNKGSDAMKSYVMEFLYENSKPFQVKYIIWEDDGINIFPGMPDWVEDFNDKYGNKDDLLGNR